METHPVLKELYIKASFDWPDGQKEYFAQQAKDAKIVQCVPMKEAFTKEQLEFIRREGYHAKMKMCYKNASDLVCILSDPSYKELFPEEIKYVEGFAYCYGVMSVEHAWVKIGDKYIDPTFERVLKKNVKKEFYASLIELDLFTMCQYQVDTGCYGELYFHNYLTHHKTENEKTTSDTPARNLF